MLPFLKKRVPFSQSKHDSKAVQQKTEMTVALLTSAVSGSRHGGDDEFIQLKKS